MTRVLPYLIGGAIGTVAGVALKKYYDENYVAIQCKLDDTFSSIDEWFDEKAVALDKYKDSLNEDSFSSTEEEITLQSLKDMKKRVYHDSFSNFISFYEKLENVNLGEIEYQEIDFSTMIIGENIYDETIQNNIKITTDLLFKANNLLSDIVLNLNEALETNHNYEKFDTKEKDLIKNAFCLAKFIQKVCISDDVAEDVVVKFNNIISDIEDEKDKN